MTAQELKSVAEQTNLRGSQTCDSSIQMLQLQNIELETITPCVQSMLPDW